MAGIPKRDAALDRRRRHSWHDRRARGLVSDPRHDSARERAVWPHHRALHGVRALRALDDCDLFRDPGDLRIEHHLRTSAALGVDRLRRILRMVAVGEIRAQLSELPVHYWSRA